MCFQNMFITLNISSKIHAKDSRLLHIWKTDISLHLWYSCYSETDMNFRISKINTYVADIGNQDF